jgi:hypothetical protein
VGGKLLLSLEKSGKLQFFGKTLTVDGQAIKLKGGKIKKVGAGGSASAKAEAAALAALAAAPAVLEFDLRDGDGAPIVNERVKAEFPDGTAREVRSNAAGKVQVPGPKAGNVKVTFPDRSRRQ